MSGFSFGTNQAAQPAAGGFSFGAPKTAAAALPTFGAPATGAAAPTFGTTSLGATASAFGQPSLGSTAPTFGAAPLGSTASTFGLSNAPTTFGAAPAGTAFGTPMLGGGVAQNTGALNFGAPQQAGTATAGAQQPTFGLGGGSSFNFGNKPTATTTATGTMATTSAGLNFGTTTTTTNFSLGGGGGLFGKPAATTTVQAGTAPIPFVGLGGNDVTSAQPKAGNSRQDHVKVKDTQVPDEIAKTVDILKNHIKIQKTISSEIGRTSTSKLSNVSSEIVNMQWALQEIANTVEANHNQIKLLRKETTRTMQSVEMGQRTQETPSGLQFENTSPFQFFQNLVAKYEQDLCNFRQQIAFTERHMQSLANPQNIAPEDLKRGFQQINESFISLAGRLHEIHQKVEQQKEQYLNLRKYRLRDSTNVFAIIDRPEVTKDDATNITAGPSPFSNILAMSTFGKTFNNSSAVAASSVTAFGGGAHTKY